MTQKSIQEANKKAPLNTSDLDLTYLKCPLKGHNNLELKFISKREFPHLTHIYCPICLIETARDINAKRPEIACLDEVFKEGINLSHKYVEALEPLIANLQAKQKKITENNLKQMCKSIDLRRRNFKKALQAFKMEISTLCKSLEDLFVKQLEAALDQNLAVLDSRFSSFKDSLEVLRYRLNSYEVELPKVLLATEDRNQYCRNINNMIKDFQTLQSTSLLEIVSQTVEDNFSTSHVAQKISTDRTLENGFADTLAKAIKVLNEKVETVKKSLDAQKQSQGESHNGKLLDVVLGHNEEKNENKNSGDMSKGEHNDGNTRKKEGSKQNEKKKAARKNMWPDPADEGIHVFDKELEVLKQEVFMRRLAESLESIANTIKNEKNNKKKMSEDGKKGEEKSKKGQSKKLEKESNQMKEKEKEKEKEVQKQQQQQQQQVKEVEKSATEAVQKVMESKEQAKNATIDGEEVKTQEKVEENVDNNDEMSDENNYVSDDEDEENNEPQRYKELITGLKATLQPEILRKVFRAKKLQRRGDKAYRKEYVKFSTVIEEREEGSRSTRSSEGKEDVSTKKELEDNKNHNNDPISQKQKEFTKNFLSQLKVRLPNPEAMTKLQKLIKKVKLHTAYKNKRLSPETIMAVQDFMGEVLRESHVKNVLEYRTNRRQLSDSEEILKYDYVCRDFFIAYYLYYKNIKSMFLDALGVPKESFNNDYKYWVEHGHTYLAWSRFKAKVQKAPLTESKRIIQVEDLKRILSQLLYFIKDPLEEFKEDIAQTQKADRYLLIELLMARVFDKAFFAFHIEEEDILCSLRANTGPSGEEAHRMYEQFESIIAGLMYPDVKIQVNTNIMKKKAEGK